MFETAFDVMRWLVDHNKFAVEAERQLALDALDRLEGKARPQAPAATSPAAGADPDPLADPAPVNGSEIVGGGV